MKYVSGDAKPGMYMVIVRGLKMNLPPVLGDTESIRKSKESKRCRFHAQQIDILYMTFVKRHLHTIIVIM